MATVKTHIEDCERILGNDFVHVHKWMDELAKKWNPFIYLEYHRQFRHHAEGVKYVKKKWGEYAEKAAKLHIIRDNEMFLPGVCTMDIIREDQIDHLYQKALKYCHPIKEGWEKEIIIK